MKFDHYETLTVYLDSAGQVVLETEDSTIRLFGEVDRLNITEDACAKLLGGHAWDRNGSDSKTIETALTTTTTNPSRRCRVCGRYEVQRTEWEAVE